MLYAARKDANDADLARIARQCGAWVVKMGQDAGFDWLLIFRGEKFIVEIKDGAKPPSARKLTDREAELKAACEYRGVTYHIIETETELLRLLGA